MASGKSLNNSPPRRTVNLLSLRWDKETKKILLREPGKLVRDSRGTIYQVGEKGELRRVRVAEEVAKK